MGSIKDMTGKRFGRLVVKRLSPERIGGEAAWDCDCNCGGTKTARGYSLRKGDTASCGCHQRERAKSANTTHGEWGRSNKKRLYRIWAGMLNRCNNLNNYGYKNYGGKGITVCNEWMDYKVFRKWAHENGYNDSLSIDRIDNNGEYSPANCRWATRKIQNNNSGNNVIVNYKEQVLTAAEFSRLINLDARLVREKLRMGWAPERIAEYTPRCRIAANGQ